MNRHFSMKSEQNFWQKYGKLISLSILLIISTVAVIQYRNSEKIKVEQQASLMYEKMLEASRKSEFSEAEKFARNLTESYAETPYAALGAMMMAKISLDQNKPKQAMENLELAVKISKNGPLHDIAALRLARVYLSDGQLDNALNALPSNNPENAFKVMVEELRGDIYFKQNDLKKAAQAYKDAIVAAPAGSPIMSLQLKYADLKTKE